MSRKCATFFAAAFASSVLACATNVEPQGTSSQAVYGRPPQTCARGPQTQVWWVPGCGTRDGWLVYYPVASDDPDFANFAGVSPDGTIENIVWVSDDDVGAFVTENDTCFTITIHPGGAPPNNGSGGPVSVAPPPDLPPLDRACVSLGDVAAFIPEAACTEPAYSPTPSPPCP